ncbi:NAD(P)-dependent dehydrogenase [Aerococcus viridans]|uniref:NAD(P)-dependent dehydrogenase n=1 Tax=Aerococcus viridans TaxID=1377 RepID=A0A2N6UFV5_9LACT|nr:SDR family oxidoreductase [Aerococcus viridans]PMC80509.1 NAD(P)-dependent dehydrogenase [Aerococcus viridans]
MNEKHLTDPRTVYYHQAFPEQAHQHPQLEQVMDPQPITGENEYQGNDRLKDRNAFITGGDSGIGRAVAIAYAREGANAVIQYLPGEEKDVEDTLGILQKEPGQFSAIPADFRESGQASQAYRKAHDFLGTVDILVLNSGEQVAIQQLQDLTIDRVKETFDVKLFSIYEIVREAEQDLVAGASIITTSSVQGFDPSPFFLDYAASNGAINNLTVSLSKYFAPKGIRVNGVAPGPVWTPLQLDGGRPNNDLSDFGQNTLLGRPGQPIEMASLYVFLASDAASYVTSQVFGATGGKAVHL